MTARLMHPNEVVKLCCLSRTTIIRLTAQGRFPKPIRISDFRIAYNSDEVEAWIAKKLAGEAA